jgi:hypothetical protein
MFTSSSHVQITGGNFVNVGGDFNLQSDHQPGSVDQVMTEVDFNLGQDSERQVNDLERTERGGRARQLPYGASKNLSPCIHMKQFVDMSQPTYYQRLTADGPGYEAGGEGHRDRDESVSSAHRRPQNARFSEYRSSLPPSLGSFMLDRPVYRAGHVTTSRISAENEYSPNQNHSADVEAGPSQPSLYPVEASSGSHPGTNNSLAFPWNRPSNAPATSIHGGTFIAGDMNNIHRHGEAGVS